MNKINLELELAHNGYPGRGIIIGRTSDNLHTVIVYFIMGRSENSRNRVFIECDGGIKTKAYDESKLTDPSLIIYAPVRLLNGETIVTNGDQTDTIFDFISNGDTFEAALRSRTFEPDPPNYTPRISGIVDKTGAYKLSILKSGLGNSDSAQRFFYEYPQPVAGEGHFIHTYKCDGEPIPSFCGEPKTVELGVSIDTLTTSIWNSLNSDNKVSLFTRFINIKTGESDTRIINANA